MMRAKLETRLKELSARKDDLKRELAQLNERKRMTLPPSRQGTRINVGLPPDLHRRVKTEAAKRGVRWRDLLIEALEAWLKR